MRVRKRKGVEAYLAQHSEFVLTEAADWQKVFDNEHPIRLEVGCGKGDFLLGQAARRPDVNFIGVDQQGTVISYALDKLLAAGLSNVRFLLINGSELSELFAPGQVDRLYLNFSDPWPKKRHEKRRLTSPMFLEIFQKLLKEDGEIHFKTDNQALFEYSLVSMSQCGLILKQVWLDLHADATFAAINVQTEYERKFSKKGPIYRCEARFK